VPKEDVPVQFKHSPILKPFEMLIDAYGLPRYGSIDPTLFVAISFLIMFGAMFGDIGHGLVLALVSLYLWKSRKENLKKAAALILYCGISSSVFGVLYGSFFGFEFESVWIKPMENILEVFKASIMLGIVLISIGILLNIINALRDKDYGKAIFDKAGLIGGVIYWAAIGLVSRVFFYKTHVPKLYSFLIFGGLLVLFLYPLFEAIFIKRHASIIESFMESIVNLLELFMGYLANTVSFIRVAAFALAHAGLFLAIFSLSEMTKTNGGLGNIAAWVIIILGNILVICLEGLVVSIQSVRLNYYEFFSKFFVSGKQAYKPLAV
jgi:V/A-type H+-transporting ATPase subunit I